MKNRYLILIIGFIAGFYSCIDDLGNYDYTDSQDLMPVKISALESEYSVIAGDPLKITPVFELLDNPARYEYIWYVRDEQRNRRDTLATTQNLDISVALAQGSYVLRFNVIDPKLGIQVSTSARLVVTTEIAAGWYVLKTQDNLTDFDYIQDKGKQINNVLSIYGYQVAGEANTLAYNTRHFYQTENEDGSISNTRGAVFHVLSDYDMQTFTAADLTRVKTYDEHFYTPLGGVNRLNGLLIEPDMYSPSLIVEGKVYTYSNLATNFGKYGAPKIYRNTTTNYKAHPEIIFFSVYQFIVYDMLSRSFLYSEFDPNKAYLSNFEKDGAVLASNLNYEVIQITKRQRASIGRMAETAYALAKDLSTNSYSIISLTACNSTSDPITSILPVPSNCELPNASVIAAPEDASGIYFANGNVLKVHYVAELANRENTLYTFPADETVAYISHLKSAQIPESAATGNYIAVLTNNAAGWKLYLFAKAGASEGFESPEPKYIASGEGKAKMFMYRAR